jgi:hypothetical protein
MFECRVLKGLEVPKKLKLVDSPTRCCMKRNKQFKSKLNIVSRILGIRYILANCDYLFVNAKILEDVCVKR